MSDWEIVRHQIAIAGRVFDEKTARPIGGARVEIKEAPREFQDGLTAMADQYRADWKNMAERPNRTHTAADGSYYFLDLPDGDYRLTASLPDSGSRYGTATSEKPAKVRHAKAKINMTTVNLALPPTALSGKITDRKKTAAAVVMADVGLKGSAERAFTDAGGHYVLTGLEAGKRKVLIDAQGYEKQSQTVELTRGATGAMDVSLEPKTP